MNATVMWTYFSMLSFNGDFVAVSAGDFSFHILHFRVGNKALSFDVEGPSLRLQTLLVRLSQEGSGGAELRHDGVTRHLESCEPTTSIHEFKRPVLSQKVDFPLMFMVGEVLKMGLAWFGLSQHVQ